MVDLNSCGKESVLPGESGWEMGGADVNVIDEAVGDVRGLAVGVGACTVSAVWIASRNPGISA